MRSLVHSTKMQKVAKTLNMLNSLTAALALYTLEERFLAKAWTLTSNPSTLLILNGELRESSDDLRWSWLQRDPVLAHHQNEHEEAEHLEGGNTKLKAEDLNTFVKEAKGEADHDWELGQLHQGGGKTKLKPCGSQSSQSICIFSGLRNEEATNISEDLITSIKEIKGRP